VARIEPAAGADEPLTVQTLNQHGAVVLDSEATVAEEA
jgi:hypothetical protein